MQYVYVCNDESLAVTNLKNGNKITIYSDNPEFQEGVNLVKTGQFAEFERQFDVKVIVQQFGATGNDNFGIKVVDGVGTVHLGKDQYPLHPALLGKIMKMNEQGFDSQPIVNFVANLYQNPSQDSIDELYLFVEKNELPITEDGYLIAYKIVNNDYMDHYTRTIRNKIGDIPEMDRNQVDPNRNATCSRGLHFCSREYLPHYGSTSTNDDHCMIVKINPADVVSIPYDYNNAKGRAWKYEVIGEVEEGWRKELLGRDYTDAAVVSTDDGSAVVSSINDVRANRIIDLVLENTNINVASTNTLYSYGLDELDVLEIVMAVEDEYDVEIVLDGIDFETITVDLIVDMLGGKSVQKTADGFFFDANVKRWRDSNGVYISRAFVAGIRSLSIEQVKELEV